MVTVPGAQEPEYAELAAFRDEHLQKQPSDRTLARAVGVSPTTVGNWLGKGQFPQEIDQLLKLVHAVRTQAERAGLAGDPAASAVLDEHKWRHVFKAEARRRAEGTSAAVQAGQGRAVLERMRPGRPLQEVADPFHLEVHHAIGSPAAGLPVLPTYVPREHDRVLAEVVVQAVAGASRIAVLVGGSSTGKTRACWETLTLLRGRDEPWRLWHPIDPTRPDAALAELAHIAPYTVIWLNEAQEYLLPTSLGEKIAAGLRTLLRDPQRTPVLVLATLWPDHWDSLTTRTETDPHAQARELLDGHRIKVPDAFTGTALDELTQAAGTDPRLGEAAEQAPDGQITQYLAGVPVLVSRFEDAPPATKALIYAAMDARRLGAGPHIPLAWLTEAAPGYLTEAEWNQSGDDWLEQALHYVTAPCNGIPGILTPVKAGTARNQRNRRSTINHTRAVHGPQYRLADYLEQHGRRHRAEMIPPIDFWTAATAHAHPTDLTTLGDAAWSRGLYRDAAQLHKHATTHGSPRAASALINHLHTLHPTDQHPVQWATAHVRLDDPGAVARLLAELQEVWEQDVDERSVIPLFLLNSHALLAERAAAHMPLDDPVAVTRLLTELREAQAQEQTTALAERAAAHVRLDDPGAVARLLAELREARGQGQTTALLTRDPAAHVRLDNPDAVAVLLAELREAQAQEQATALAERAVAHMPLDNPVAVARLLAGLREAQAQEQATALLARDPAAHVRLNNPDAVTRLLTGLRKAQAQEQATALAERAAAMPLDNPFAVARLLAELREAQAQEQTTALTKRLPAAGHFDLFNRVDGHRERFRFGREPDGSVAASWGWEDLE
ncbi:hypothetical protein [Streptomyces europaeiscabiei]|uniref:hypothetical protein n=1 Tax=Streptomyces europaeiscabiei TaxID=146819 RepID=UPI000765AB62|nr:hypothetical protein [Streptomyces europaeiscabiei]MDX3867561.1 hypothetical protein [Streptomyces europaeiscabiei]